MIIMGSPNKFIPCKLIKGDVQKGQIMLISHSTLVR